MRGVRPADDLFRLVHGGILPAAPSTRAAPWVAVLASNAPARGVFSFELRELRHRGRSAIGGKEYRLFAHTRELGEVTLIPNMDRYARAEIGPLVRALTALVRAEAARPEGR